MLSTSEKCEFYSSSYWKLNTPIMRRIIISVCGATYIKISSGKTKTEVFVCSFICHFYRYDAINARASIRSLSLLLARPPNLSIVSNMFRVSTFLCSAYRENRGIRCYVWIASESIFFLSLSLLSLSSISNIDWLQHFGSISDLVLNKFLKNLLFVHWMARVCAGREKRSAAFYFCDAPI